MDKFKDKAYAAQFLTAALEGDDSMNLQYVLVDVIEANGGFSKVADLCGMNEEALRVMVHDETEHWKFLRLARLLKSMGLNLTMTSDKE